MTIIANYGDWLAARIEQLEAEGLKVKCPECSGSGCVYEICHCCDGEKEEECAECCGDGWVLYNDLGDRSKRKLLSRRDYFDEVVRDLKQWCWYTGEDFLGRAGAFVNEFRREGF